MRTHPVPTRQLYSFPDFGSLTPRGWSDESEKLRDAETVSLTDFFGVPASRLHLLEGGDYRSVLREAGRELSNILSVFRNRLPEGVADQIGRRIGVLIDSAEWDIEDELPIPESFRRLLSFLAAHRELRHPSIFLDRHGLFTASWRPEKRKLASLAFRMDGTVNWLVFLPQKGDETGVIESKGRAPLDILLKIVGKHGALSWMRQPTLLARLFGNA